MDWTLTVETKTGWGEIKKHHLGTVHRGIDVVFMYGGEVHETAPVAEFFNAPETQKAKAFVNGDIVE